MERQIDPKLIEEVKEELYCEFLENLIIQDKALNCEDYDCFENDMEFEPINIPDDVCDITKTIMEAYNDKEIDGLEFACLNNGMTRAQYKRLVDMYKDPFINSPINRIAKELGYKNVVDEFEKGFREIFMEES